jgi:hypothetical protein
MNGSDLAKMYEFSYTALNRNLDGVSNEESLITPQPCGNCLNWVLGHVVTARNMVLLLTGGEVLFTGEQSEVYRRGSSPDANAKYLDWGTLRGFLNDSQQQLVPTLAAMSDEALARDVPEKYRRPPLMGSVGGALVRLQYHEAYHSGQIGLLRRLAGKDGALG